MSGGDKTIVIYLDVLFGINFIMDLTVIFIVNKLCRFGATPIRLLLSAATGAIWSITAVILPDNIQILINICTYVLISLLMVKICALNSSFADVLKGVVTLYGVTFVLAGAIHMLYYYTYAGYIIHMIFIKNVQFAVFIMLSLIILYIVYIQYMRIKIYGRYVYRVVIEAASMTFELKGYADTGNVLVDPYNNQPVSVAQKSSFQCIFENKGNFENAGNFAKIKYHIIPFSSVGCENGLLEVITADNMYIYAGKEILKFENVMIGLTDIKLSSDGEFQILLNAALMQH